MQRFRPFPLTVMRYSRLSPLCTPRHRDGTKRWAYALALSAALLMLAPAMLATPVAAAATVSNCNDSGGGSLRTAIATGGTITFTTDCPATSPIKLTSGSLMIGVNLAIDGTGHTIVVDGNNAVSVFTVSAYRASLTNLTIQHGNGGSGPGGGISAARGGGSSLALINTTVTNNQAAFGGGIYIATGALTLTNSTVSNNTAGNGNGIGGGIYCAGCSRSAISTSGLDVTGSTISGNRATTNVGGILVVDAAMTMTNSTVSGNTAAGQAGGIETFQAANNASFTLVQSTISGNSAATGNGIVIRASPPPTIQNSIINNDCTGTGSVASAGYNIDNSGGTCHLTGTGDRSGDPGIGPLANNGGPTQTYLPLTGSQAIDQIPNTGGCNGAGVATDQRGVARPQPAGGLCDIGSVEVQATAPTVTGIAPSSGPTTGGSRVTITGTGFQSGLTVRFGGPSGSTATIVSVSSTQIILTTPAHTAGTVDVVITNPDNGVFTLPNGYTYGIANPLPATRSPGPPVLGSPPPLPPTRPGPPPSGGPPAPAPTPRS
ncbi:MAG: choice-of-anchor Q domain-containing protein [Thermomicrobiales bacterium]